LIVPWPATLPGLATVRSTRPRASRTHTVMLAGCNSRNVSAALACELTLTLDGISTRPDTATPAEVGPGCCLPGAPIPVPDGCGPADGYRVGDGLGVVLPALEADTNPRQTLMDAGSVSRSVGYCWLPSK